MIETVIVLLLVGMVIAGVFLSPLWVQQRRDRRKRQTFPPLWTSILENHLDIYHALSAEERRRLQGHIQVFLAEKQFIGCNGLQVSEEMRLVIAAIACLLLLNEQGGYFPKLRSILIYPSAYWVTETIASGNFVVEERRVARLGESWATDQLVLSWEQVQYDTSHWQDGRNVVLHEFTHQLDQAEGRSAGVPTLSQPADYQLWAEVMTQSYQQLCQEVQHGGKTVIDRYGATNPAEFFAVVTETFFEKPQPLLKQHPTLYQLLKRFYRLDPVQWMNQ